MRGLWKLVGVVAPLMAAGAAFGQELDVGRNLISVVTSSRHMPVPTARCLVWADAEDLGVGPTQLGGMHGLTMYIEPKPLPSESAQPTTFAAGLATMKAQYPQAPAWLVKTLQKNQSKIEAACEKDHDMPFKVYGITKKDTAA
jgi:hypothetical protein